LNDEGLRAEKADTRRRLIIKPKQFHLIEMADYAMIQAIDDG